MKYKNLQKSVLVATKPNSNSHIYKKQVDLYPLPLEMFLGVAKKSFHKWSIFQKVQINFNMDCLVGFCFQRFQVLDIYHDKYLNVDENQLLCLL